MGVDKGYVEKKWDCGIAFLEKVHCSVNTPEGMHLFFRQVVRATNPSVGGNTVGHAGVSFIAVVVLLQPFDIVVMVAPCGIGQLHVVEAIALAFGGQVEFADHLCLVSRPGQFARQGVRRMPLSTFESDNTICCGCCASHEAATSGYATGAFGVSAVKVRASAGNPVQVGCLQTWGTIRVKADTVAALLVGHDEQDIWLRI